ncbi:MAG: PAS domain-containing protein [SAR202 cluster bacterium]|nr:PAS domain-containing protein [SAR202 cluster bacterium]
MFDSLHKVFKGNLLAQFSVISFVIMLILAVALAVIVGEVVRRDITQIRQEAISVIAEVEAGLRGEMTIPDLGAQAGRIRWVIAGAIGGGFFYLYLTLVYMVWEGYRTIKQQQTMLEATNEAVTRERATLQAIQESIIDGLVVIDPDGLIQYCNATAAALLDTYASQIQRRSMHDFLQEKSSMFETEEMQDAAPKFYRAQGCNFCRGTGYDGRTGIFEVMTVTEGIRKLIVAGASGQEIRTQAISEGMIPLRRAGMLKAKEGVTTVSEVLRRVFFIT